MKKKSIILLIFIILLLVLVKCSSKYNERNFTGKTSIETYQLSDFDGEITQQATWVIAPDEDNLQDGITVIVTNLTNERYPGPNRFWLEIEENNQWYIIPYKEPGFPDAFPRMAPNAENEFVLGVNYHYGELKAGHYRVICEDKTKHRDNDYLILEFDVP